MDLTRPGQVLWQPDEKRISASNWVRFVSTLRQDPNAGVSTDYADSTALYNWSLKHPEQFWESVAGFCRIKFHKPWDRVRVLGERLQDTVWFPGCRLNFAENLLQRCDDKAALIFRGEDGQRRVLSYRALRSQVAALANHLRAGGVTTGDRVAGYLPNIPETVVAMLATATIGAIWSSCSPDFGIEGVMERFGQIQPKALFVVDGYRYAGKHVALMDRARELATRLDSVRNLYVVPFLAESVDLGSVPKAIDFQAAIRASELTEPPFTPLAFDHPLYILYSSGTTGKPKCIVHGAGGTLLQHLKELVLHTDLKVDDTIFYFTTCGWMMWNWLVSSLAVGATIVLYDGSPVHPHTGALLDIAEQEGITVFGASARYYALIEKAGLQPRETHDLHAIKTFLSTGSPLAAESFDYIYQAVHPDAQLASISGGTDIISCFALGNPVASVYRGELQCRGLGMQVEIFNAAGQSVTGEKGELVCTAPFPSMPVGFWNDNDGQRYHTAYFAKYPGVWAHGDYAELTATGGMIIHGRSDAVLNPGGVRIGTAEIYRPVEQFNEVLECIAVDQDWHNDRRIVLFVRLRDDVLLDQKLIDRIKLTIRTQSSPRHVPAKIVQVADIPRTKNGKLVELAVRQTVHGTPVVNLDAIANPEALQYFRDLEVLQHE